ncbi:cytochrome b [Roseibium litorale]|uniref:Cytochrome b n=1 Tax=Roseibium litorale TaxID=2803841 RepID=A0ABR9CIL4_9HYPH|nr:cytochrome b/b6 domain-containing protein [Roseibium litorale]MBD8890662.1 cytochrome b [Roseibium litorale]
MSPTQPAAYSRLHIVLHWLIAALVVFQLIFGEAIGQLGRALRDGRTLSPLDTILGNAHIYGGVAILLLTVLRLGIRHRQGVPTPLPSSAWQEQAAKWTHVLFYALLLITPLTGLAAWFLDIHLAGEFHELMKPVFILLIVIHVGATLWHQVVLKDGILKRMM